MPRRSRSPAVRNSSREMAISAPVLPAETAARASPDLTLSTAFHIDEPLPRRIACAGLARPDAISTTVTSAAGNRAHR